ncbi:Mitotic spindle checkpoint component mad2 [Haplosporangium sp. Z 767]|nr:Mitotic spindle checkpoint component mad2 [Haplosporangium sp. Z 767]KAF9190150.1 Mitotic spindle checkpoint component mad2 [Haplosporangium sp. Z 11]
MRGLYAPEDFKMTKKYGMNMLVTTVPEIKSYMREMLKQVEVWLMQSKVKKLIMVIKSKETMEILERWQFDIHVTKDHQQQSSSQDINTSNNSAPGTMSSSPSSSTATTTSPKPTPEKSEKEIHAEIQAILRQITASVTFLPMLDEKCTWTILCQTDRDVEVPAEWSDTDHHLILNAEQVKLRSFSTSIHKVDAMVAYRLQDDM